MLRVVLPTTFHCLPSYRFTFYSIMFEISVGTVPALSNLFIFWLPVHLPLLFIFLSAGFPLVQYIYWNVSISQSVNVSPPALRCMFWTGAPDDSCSHNQLVRPFLLCPFFASLHPSLEFLPRPLGLQQFEHILFKQFCKSYYSAAVIYSRITIFRVKEGFWYGKKMGTNAVKEKKKERKKEKSVPKREEREGKKPHERWSLKMNEKICNPWVTAWIKENQYLLSIHLGLQKSLKWTKVVNSVANIVHVFSSDLVLLSLKYKFTGKSCGSFNE